MTKYSRIKHFLALLAIAVGIVMPLQAGAANVWHTGSTLKVASIYALGDGGIAISLSTNAPTCPNTNHYLYLYEGANGVTAAGFKHVLAAVYMAYANDRTIAVYFDDATSSCYIAKVEIY